MSALLSVPFALIADLLVADWLVVVWYAPSWVILTGTEHIGPTKPYLHHFRGLLIGTASSVFIGLTIAVLLNSPF
jgi:hypothetical protein